MLDFLVVFHVGKCTVRPMDTSWVREFWGTCATNRRIFPHPNPANPSASSSVPSASREDEKGGRGGGKHVGVFFKGWNKKIRWWVEQWFVEAFFWESNECSNHHSWVAMLVFSGVICFRRGVYKKPRTKSIQFDISPKHPYHLCMQ